MGRDGTGKPVVVEYEWMTVGTVLGVADRGHVGAVVLGTVAKRAAQAKAPGSVDDALRARPIPRRVGAEESRLEVLLMIETDAGGVAGRGRFVEPHTRGRAGFRCRHREFRMVRREAGDLRGEPGRAAVPGRERRVALRALTVAEIDEPCPPLVLEVTARARGREGLAV